MESRKHLLDRGALSRRESRHEPDSDRPGCPRPDPPLRRTRLDTPGRVPHAHRSGRISKRGSAAARWALVEAAWSVVAQPGPLHGFYARTRARRGHGKAIVATARKLSILFWHMLCRDQDYAHQQPSLTKKKLRRLELTAGAPKRAKTAAGTWSTNQAIRQAERELAEQAELSYKRLVQDQQAAGPGKRRKETAATT